MSEIVLAGLFVSAPAAAAVIVTVAMFLRYLVKRDTVYLETQKEQTNTLMEIQLVMQKLVAHIEGQQRRD